MTLCYGKLPATEDPRDLKLGAYLRPAKLPAVPAVFGHQALIPPGQWGMLGNDQFGDCAWAGPAHETMLLTKLGGRPASFTAADVLADYSAGTGFDPNDPSTDRGSNVRDVAKYRVQVGLRDDAGHRHKIAAYVSIDPGNIGHVRAGAYLFEAVGIGIQVPSSAQEQFAAGQPWDVVRGASIEGGHYVPYLGEDHDFMYVVTWGKVQPTTRAFFTTYCDEAFAYLSTEDLKGGKSPEGFNAAQLRADLAAVA